ncbi:serine hydrolase domain-containing protein [Pedococcus sp. 5OH_020]|uniref:serine hydrolase domain-containing protein n=1 Tax=Pedococcus sp. 5OH_020 TaxID=2989814 RepID=UPI0022E9A477|nr:serine hydrolase domain-containing protein [Pedococcus sp. 5OH_020]
MALDPGTVRQLGLRLATEQSQQRLPSVVAGLVRGGRLVWADGAGMVDGRAGGAPPTSDTQYRIGSITKTFVGVLVMRLRDEGLVELNHVVATHLPETADTAFGQVRLAELLSHTSGLQAETAGPWWERTAGAGWSDLLASAPQLRFRPGARFHYSNIGYAVLGELVCRLRGQPWEAVLQAELLEPLGMSRTTPRPVPPAASGWGVHPLADLLHVEPEHDAGAMAPAGQLWSTVEDLSRWAAFLAGDTSGLLDGATLEEMCLPVAVNDNPGLPWAAAHGLGWQVWNLEGARWAGHGGSMPGFLATLRVNRDSGDGCVLFANATSGMSTTVTKDLLDILADREPVLPTPWTADEAQVSALELVGDWYWGTTAYTLRLAGEGHVVLGEPGVRRGSRFRPTGSGWVGLDGYHEGEPLVVVRDARGAVSHLDLGSFRFSRLPYDPTADIPGGVHDDRWH